MKRLLIIPARGGSKRIPNKNIKDFCGLPMLGHAINIAQAAGIFNVIHVSTDSTDIADIAEKYGHKPLFSRPNILSDDQAPMMEAIKFVVEEYEKRGVFYDTVVLLYATSPLTDSNDLVKACAQFEKEDKVKALLAVTSYPAPIEQAFRMKANKDLIPNDAIALEIRTQDLDHAWYDAGMFAIYSSEYVKLSKNGGDFTAFRGYNVAPHRVTDIDWPEDWVRAEALFRVITASKTE